MPKAVVRLPVAAASHAPPAPSAAPIPAATARDQPETITSEGLSIAGGSLAETGSSRSGSDQLLMMAFVFFGLPALVLMSLLATVLTRR